jgi:hypothetical protein
MSAHQQFAKTPQERFMELARHEMDAFEKRERDLRHQLKKDRAAKLNLPVYVNEGLSLR